MTLPEPSPTANKEAQCGGSEAGEDADDEASPTAAPPPPPPPPTATESMASRSTSVSGSRRTSECGLGDGLGDGLLGDCSRRSSTYGLSGPMRDIMDGATIPTTPRYIFKAHEMTKDVRLLLQECLHTDVILVAADEEIPAHTKILKAHGGALFEMAEQSGPEGRVPLPDMSGEVLLEVLRYVYTRTAPAVERMPRALLSAAHRAALPGLKDRCAEVLVQRMHVHNVTEMFELADNNEEERLKQAAAVLFLENAKESTMDFGSMSTGTRIMHLIARIYMVAIVPVIGYVLYASVRNKIRAARGLDGNGTAASTASEASKPSTAAEVVADLVNATVQHTVAVVTGVEEDEFFTSPGDE
ncbi:hypothetical protein FOCC_FOCC012263, partial [Frankliniella occidentalis]